MLQEINKLKQMQIMKFINESKNQQDNEGRANWLSENQGEAKRGGYLRSKSLKGGEKEMTH